MICRFCLRTAAECHESVDRYWKTCCEKCTHGHDD